MTDEQRLRDALSAIGIAPDWHEHEAVFTVQESDAVHAAMPGVHTKNLFLKDAGGRFWLVTVPSDARVDLKALAPALGAKKFSFGKPEAMAEFLRLTPGSVTPLGAINDDGGAVTVVLDAVVAGAGRVNVHPLRNTATIGLSGADLQRALAACGHEAVIVDVPLRAE